ncbi:MAG: NAD(P)/FAD-dependent oxidoreductase [Candidatus Bipolaricaulota bacterium]
MADVKTKDGRKRVAIIGGGVAGLCAGCYAQMNGYQATIYEMHNLPGGVCTAWQRSGYTIDSCIHWLVGTSPASSYHKLWREVGALRGLSIIDQDEFMRVELKGGRALVFYRDADRFEKHLLELGPEDGRAIRALTCAIRRLSRFDMSPDNAPELSSIGDKIAGLARLVPVLPLFAKWGRMSVQDFAKRLKSPTLKEAFGSSMGSEAESWPMLGLMFPLMWQATKSAGYPLGGSLPFVRNIEKRFRDLGGEIRTSARVEKILTESDRAVGVRLADGSEHQADVVISAADGRTTIFEMLEGRYVNDKVRKPYEGGMTPFPPLLYVALGVADPLDNLPQTNSGISFPLDPEVEIDGKARDRLSMHVYNFDRSLAPKGKTTIIVMLGSDYERWTALREDAGRYRAEKEVAAERVIDALEQRLPGIRGKIEMRDVATPVTWERYTGNWRGSYEGWLPNAKSLGAGLPKTLPGLSDFYMCGQWVAPGGGLPPAVSTARHVVQLLCKADGKTFTATEA